MDITINVLDYLDEEEIKAMVKDGLAAAIEKDAERILNNAAYQAVWTAVDAALDGNSKEKIINKAVEIINNLTDFSVFRRKGHGWDDHDSIAQAELNRAVLANTDLIQKKVKHIIETHDYESDLRNNSEYFAEIVLEAIRKGLKEAS